MKRISALCSVLVILLAALALISPSLWADQPLDDPKPKPEWGEDLVVEFPRFPDSTRNHSGIAGSMGASQATFAAWSKLAFQTYEGGGNWEIYVADGVGNNPLRLTYDPASDLYPHLNRGTTHVVFASNRDGDFEIYSANLDGSGLRQLTSNTSTDTRPVWSPDGTKIAFQAYRDGIAEIYVMNADGSGQTRLTNDGAGSIHPSWAPDGTKIAFASLRGGQYAIWTMNPNGTGFQHIGAAQPYAEHPVWSPAGTHIAYDADTDSDGFMELWLMNADGSNQHILLNTFDNADIWPASWSATANDIAFTRIHWIFYNGNWYWTEARLMFLDMFCFGGCSPQLIRTSDVEWHPAWQTSDAFPPQALARPLPEYSRCNSTPVSWAAYDPGESGVLYYEVQYREGSGSWQNWQLSSSESETFYGSCGKRVSFRVRARDRAHNLSAWSADSGAPGTWFYQHALTGTLLDNRAMRLPRATFVISPVVVNTVQTNVGTYQAYLAQAGNHQVQVSKLGYSPLPASTWNISSDKQVNFYLPSGANLITNGGFEGGGGSLMGWQGSGSLTPTATISHWHTGGASARLEAMVQPVLAAPEVITGGIGSDPDFAIASDGTIHVVYHNANGVHHIQRSPAGVWEMPTRIDVGNIPPFIAITPSDEIHVIWSDGYGVYHRSLAPGGTWTNPIWLAWGTEPEIAPDLQGGIHVVYQRNAYTVAYLYRSSAGVWSSPQDVMNGIDPRITIGPDNSKHIIVHNGASTGYLWYCSSSPIGFDCSTDYRSGQKGRLVADDNGKLHILWTENSKGYYSTRSEGIWLTPQEIPDYAGYGDLAVDSSGAVYAVNTDSAATYLRAKPANGEWLPPIVISQTTSGIPVILTDADDQLHIVHEAGSSATNYLTSLSPQAESQSAINQVLTLPANAHRPTLSFLWQSSGGGISTSISSMLRVFVSNGLTTTLIYSSSEGSSEWRHAWVDLSSWSGQSITLSLSARSVGYPSGVRIWLDEISLGSWLTPIVTDVSPSKVDVSAGKVITITGQNFITTPAAQAGNTALLNVQRLNDTTLRATLPTGLSPGKYDIWVINPGGQDNVLPGGLQVGKLVYLPTILKQYIP